STRIPSLVIISCAFSFLTQLVRAKGGAGRSGNGSGGDGLSPASIGGIVAGAIVILRAGAVLWDLCSSRRRRKALEKAPDDAYMPMHGHPA
ncbi:hypothetical protein BG004_001127, partial [Podila humilis]